MGKIKDFFLANKIVTVAIAAAAVITTATVVTCILLPSEGNIHPSGMQSFPEVKSGEEQEQIIEIEVPSEYEGVVLDETSDAGEQYIKDTLFVGDSNTARMYFFGLLGIDNLIGVEGMGIQSVAGSAVAYFYGYNNPVTIPTAISMQQPRRVIINFGTNNVAGYSVDAFVSEYNKALDAIQNAYSYSDIIIMAVAPVSETTSYDIDNKRVDAYNEALMKLAKQRGLHFLNISEVLKNSKGAIKDNYVVEDGIHLTTDALNAVFKYARTHALITEDTRPTLTSCPARRPAPVIEKPKFDEGKVISYINAAAVESGFTLESYSSDISSRAFNSYAFTVMKSDAEAGTEQDVAMSIFEGFSGSTARIMCAVVSKDDNG